MGEDISQDGEAQEAPAETETPTEDGGVPERGGETWDETVEREKKEEEERQAAAQEQAEHEAEVDAQAVEERELPQGAKPGEPVEPFGDAEGHPGDADAAQDE